MANEETVSVDVLMRVMRYLSETEMNSQEILAMAQSILSGGTSTIEMESVMRMLRNRLEKESPTDAVLNIHSAVPPIHYCPMTVEELGKEPK